MNSVKTFAWTSGIVLGLGATFQAAASNVVTITSDLNSNRLRGAYEVGELLPVSFFVSTDGGAGVFGIELTIAVDSDDLRIGSVDVAPAFERVIERSNAGLPAGRIDLVCLQPQDAINAALGANGEAVPLLTVEFEVLNGDFFRSAIDVSAKAALVGGEEVSTVVLGGAPSEHGPAHGRIRVVGFHHFDASRYGVLLIVKPLGGGLPVLHLQADTTYELHYTTTCPEPDSFVLFTAGSDGDTANITTTLPPQGPWSGDANHLFLDLEAAGGPVPVRMLPEGFFRYTMTTNTLVGQNIDHAGQTGHLCNFTTAAPGPFALHLFLWSTDANTGEVTERETALIRSVE